jgi:hypothetical protein
VGHPEEAVVIPILSSLSAAKDLVRGDEILHFVQDDDCVRMTAAMAAVT